MKKIIFVLTLLLFAGSVNSQNLMPVRLEVPSSIDVETFHVEPLDNRGVLIFYESNDHAAEYVLLLTMNFETIATLLFITL